MHEISDEFFRQVDPRVDELWKQGDWKTFVRMLPGLLGRTAYDESVEVITPYFPSSGTGQNNAVLPV